MHDSLYRNSTFLITSQAVAAVSGFLFWVINAHLFTAQNVGLAISFISFGMLVATFTNLGLPNTIIRFLPASKRRGGLFSASLILVLLSSIIGTAISLLVVRHFAHTLAYIHSSLTFIINPCFANIMHGD